MSDIESYAIVAGRGANDLASRVVAMLKDGFIPQGGIAVRTLNKFEVELVQAMVRFEPKLDKEQ